MAFCISCGNKQLDGAKFCAECGAPAPNSEAPHIQSESSNEATPVVARCVNGHEVDTAGLVCGVCLQGAPVDIPEDERVEITSYRAQAEADWQAFVGMLKQGMRQFYSDSELQENWLLAVRYLSAEHNKDDEDAEDQECYGGFGVGYGGSNFNLMSLVGICRMDMALAQSIIDMSLVGNIPLFECAKYLALNSGHLGSTWNELTELRLVNTARWPQVRSEAQMNAQSGIKPAPVMAQAPSAPKSVQLTCPHCKSVGTVSQKRKKQKQGISGGKATAAVLTGGLSLFATGLSRKNKVTEMHCSACKVTWLA